MDKDRHGQVGAKNKPVAIVRGSWHDGGFSLRVDKPQGRPTAAGELDSRIVHYLAGFPDGRSLEQIRNNVKGKNQTASV